MRFATTARTTTVLLLLGVLIASATFNLTILNAVVFGSESLAGDVLLATRCTWSPLWAIVERAPFKSIARVADRVPGAWRLWEVLSEIDGRFLARNHYASGDVFLIGMGMSGYGLSGLDEDSSSLSTAFGVQECAVTFGSHAYRMALEARYRPPDIDIEAAPPLPSRLPPDSDIVSCRLGNGEIVELAIQVRRCPCIDLPQYHGHNREMMRLLLVTDSSPLRPKGYYLDGWSLDHLSAQAVDYIHAVAHLKPDVLVQTSSGHETSP